ncbi:hypothetical protein H1R20_g15577, partial [Candolleomyces eurysporus]
MQHLIECPLDFDSLPVEWEELPLPKLYRHSLEEAVYYLPSFLSDIDGIDDDEVVGFTQNGGWQKINNLLPLLFRSVRYSRDRFDRWITALHYLTDRLKARKSEATAVISVFVDKWENDHKQYKDEQDIENLDSDFSE